ncbi:hypothetical protein BY447_1293 [Pantoea sp. JKS000250]|nr:hypothetical protein BY447_1293 [Pantoea sp. JKS000250]
MPVRKAIGYILIFEVMQRKALLEKDDQAFEMFELRTQKSPQSFHLAGSQDFDDGSGNHQSGKYPPGNLISLTRPDVLSSGIHEQWFPKVQAKNQTRIVS